MKLILRLFISALGVSGILAGTRVVLDRTGEAYAGDSFSSPGSSESSSGSTSSSSSGSSSSDDSSDAGAGAETEVASEPPVDATMPPFDPAQGQWSLWPLGDKEMISQGDQGEIVRYLQGVLVLKAGQHIEIDGRFGPDTTVAVENVQRLFGLEIDGYVGPETWKAIDGLAST